MGQVNQKKLRKQAKKNQRELDREIRNISRDLKQIDKQELTLKASIRKEAEAGNTDKVRQIAKQIVRCQKHQKTLDQTRGRLQDVKMELSSMVSMQMMTETMRKMAKMMKRMNKRTNHIKMAKIMQRFEQEKMKGEMNQELMDDLMDDYQDEAAEDELVDQILAEVGVMNITSMESAPTGMVTERAEPVAVGETAGGEGNNEEEVDDLEARMKRLNNPDDDNKKE